MMEPRKLPIHVLYLEDNPSVRTKTASYLARHIASLHTTTCGQEALNLCRETKPDLIVTDMEVPDIDGIRLIRQFREFHPEIPIFVTTTFENTVRLTEAIQSGIDHYLYKRTDPAKLLESIRDYFRFLHRGYLTLTIDEKHRVVEVSETFANFLGYAAPGLLFRPVSELLKIVGDESPRFFSTWQEGEERENLQAIFRRNDGTETIMGGSGTRKRGEKVYKTRWYPIECLFRSQQEISEQLRREHYIKSLMRLHAQISQEAIRAEETDLFLQEILDRLTEIDPSLTGCLLENGKGLRLILGSRNTEVDFTALFPKTLDLDEEENQKSYLPCFLAAIHEQTVFIDNITLLQESRFKRLLLEYGIETVVSIPFRHTQESRQAILTLLFKTEHRFDKEELELWQNIANTMGFGITSIRLRIERDALIRKLDIMAHTDSLTGVLNRYRGVELIRHEILRAQRYGQLFSVLFFDIDNFKTINDTFGHEVGDRVLKGLAQTVSSSLRSTDTLIRWGGEEFLILLPSIGVGDAVLLAQKLRKKIEERESEIPLPVTASFGAAEWRPGQTLDTLISRADAKMYEAKRLGRNRICY